VKVTIAFDRLRWEEKALAEASGQAGLEAELVDVKGMALGIGGRARLGGIVLNRCVSHHRSLALSRALESAGSTVINPSYVAEVCGNKLLTSIALSKAGVPTPRTMVALSSEGAEAAAAELGFPFVMKPFSGSWGRMVTMVRDMDSLQSILEYKEELGNPMEQIHYVQEYVRRPPRDIRVIVAGKRIVACVHRYSPEGEWKTNVARGGVSRGFEPDRRLRSLTLKAAEAVGGGVLGVDAMESDGGYLVHEVNNTVEFKGAQSAVGHSIPRMIMEYVVKAGGA
jgi:[lysine-biosynthesis-protein LysW]---L-2-aminoadipate ligase